MEKVGQIYASLQTHQGQVRDHNEDFVTYWEPADPEGEMRHGWVYIVADGVGGAEAGEVASQFASERTLSTYLANVQEPDWGQRLLIAMQKANTELRQMVAEQADNARMATTMVAAVIEDDTVHLANVGDSRGYLWRHGVLRQITKDQSLVAKLLEEGAITEAEAENHPRKNVILYSLGSEREPKIDLFQERLLGGDALVLCSDGLTRHVTDEEIAAIVGANGPTKAAKALIKRANERGGEDNISVAVIHYHTEDSYAKTAVERREPEMEAEDSSVTDRTWLLSYTILLSFMQTILIVIAWLIFLG